VGIATNSSSLSCSPACHASCSLSLAQLTEFEEEPALLCAPGLVGRDECIELLLCLRVGQTFT